VNATKTVQNRSPIALFTESAETVDTHEVIYLNASLSYDPDGSIVSYFWDFGDGINAMGKTTSHSYADNGTYIVTLTVTDDDGATGTLNSIKTVNNKSPVAVFTKSTETAYTAQTVTFNASDSYDSDGTIVEYFWDFGDGTNTSGIVANHPYADNGNYTVKLTVKDNDGASTTAIKVATILNQAPVVSFSGPSSQPIVGMTMTFNASGSYDPDGMLLNYTWNFGDGNITATKESVITHVYSQSASFNVTLTVTDNDGQSALAWQLVFVHVHNVAVVNVTISHTEVQIGGTISISVTVKNKGTTTESFNISMLCNSTEIATQQVLDLPSGVERVLVFYWNTSSVRDTAKFLIQIRASTVPYESDATDNNYTGGFVNVLKLQDNGFSFWPPSGWSWLLFAIPPLVLLIIGVTRKKRNAGEVKDIRYLDEITNGPIPDGFSVLVSGEAGSGKSVLCQELTYGYLEVGKPCVYATYDCFPDEIRNNIQKFHGHLSEYETSDRFMFIDCYSSIAKVESKEKYFLGQPFSLADLGIVMSKVTGAVNAPLRMLLDSVVPLLTHVDPQKVVEFLQDRSARIKGVNGTFIFTVGKETIESSLISRLEEVVDCIIELDVIASKGKKVRRLRVKKMRGRKPWEKWVPFRIDPAKGIVFMA
jgi:KaiC/GvpD/RAD55 family RecA-like ATPase/PKD repeat protein